MHASVAYIISFYYENTPQSVLPIISLKSKAIKIFLNNSTFLYKLLMMLCFIDCFILPFLIKKCYSQTCFQFLFCQHTYFFCPFWDNSFFLALFFLRGISRRILTFLTLPKTFYKVARHGIPYIYDEKCELFWT